MSNTTEVQVPVESLTEGTLADLEPLLVAWGARDESFEADLMVAQCELANVESVTVNPDGTVTIFSDQMNLTVPAGTSVITVVPA